jgi:acetyltransferase-like isoleucine patch superfamily enzyme
MGIGKRIKDKIINKIRHLILYQAPPPYLFVDSVNIVSGTKSYHNGNFNLKGNGKFIIGNYCAIGENFKVILSNHSYTFPSVQYSLYFENFKEYPFKYSKINTITVGNDVWIGDDVIVLPNVNIGDGVCIGAGSIVTKDVPDYAIVAGNPARIIKYRFNENQISYLKKIQWWLWDPKKISENRNFFFKIPNEQ